jgi:hypothetical protein
MLVLEMDCKGTSQKGRSLPVFGCRLPLFVLADGSGRLMVILERLICSVIGMDLRMRCVTITYQEMILRLLGVLQNGR